MNERLKKWLGRNPFWYSFLQMCKYRNDREYIGLIRGLRDNPNIVNLHADVMKFERPVCLIEAGGKNDGFFACVRWALDGLYFCDQYGFTPVLKFSDQSLYRDESFPDSMNAFEYFFEQPAEVELQDIKNHSYIQYSSRNRLLAEGLNGGVNYEVTSVYEEKMAEIMDKYLRFNNNTRCLIEKCIKERITSDDILGVHIRGTDYKENYKNHPSYVPPEDYYPYVRNALSSGIFKKIYLATDDQEILEAFIREFGEENVLYARNIIRGTGSVGIHTAKKNNRYQVGLEVICDMATLSYCKGLISGLSQVGVMTRIFKMSRHEEFLYDKKLDKGINASEKSFSV